MRILRLVKDFSPAYVGLGKAAVASLPKVAREVRLRFGIVLGDGGGYLSKLILPSRLGLGTILGNGEQWVSWIHRDDVIGVIENALTNSLYQGPINVVAPEAVRQSSLQKILSGLFRAPIFLKAPGPLLRLLLGDFSHMLLDSQKIVPRRLIQLQYNYRFPNLEAALIEAANIHKSHGEMLVCHRLEAAQFVPRPTPAVFAFFADPHNLEKITPPLLSFKIQKVSTPQIEKSTVIDYRLKVHGIPMKWKTLIKNWEKEVSFVDNQEHGPYRIWHHTHSFYPVPQGTLMTDKVLYRLPMGILGDLFGLPLVKRDVKKIFAYRRRIIEDQFRSR